MSTQFLRIYALIYALFASQFAPYLKRYPNPYGLNCDDFIRCGNGHQLWGNYPK
jgi:hypothetical protein